MIAMSQTETGRVSVFEFKSPCSGEEEGNDGVVDVISSELQMVTYNFNELDPASLIEGLHAKVVVLVEVRVLKGHHAAKLVQLLEPLGLFGVHHCVLREHHQERSVKGREAGLSISLGGVVVLLVVDVGKEDGASQVLGLVVGVHEVACGANHVLNEAFVDKAAHDLVDQKADFAVEAHGDISDAHVGSTEGGPVADLALDGA